VNLRQEGRLRSGWAELCAIDLQGRVSVLCSFGRERPLRWRPLHTLMESGASGSAPKSRSLRPLRRRIAAGVTGLAAIGALALTAAGDDSTNHRPAPSTPVVSFRTGEAVDGCVGGDRVPWRAC
jgi:hypothetical protein